MDERLSNGWTRRIITNSSRVKELQWFQKLHENALYKLRVTFVNGGTYLYKDVFYPHLKGLLESESVGKGLQTYILANNYKYEKISE